MARNKVTMELTIPADEIPHRTRWLAFDMGGFIDTFAYQWDHTNDSDITLHVTVGEKWAARLVDSVEPVCRIGHEQTVCRVAEAMLENSHRWIGMWKVAI